MKKIFQSIIMLLAVMTLTVEAHAADDVNCVGDVNCDDGVNIADVTALIDYILDDVPSMFSAANADVNHDGLINIADVTTLIDYILGGTWPSDEQRPETETFTVGGVTFTMVTVEGGTFTMQTTDSYQYHDYLSYFDRQSHQVTLSSYCIGQTEVTQELWEAVMGSNLSYYNDDWKQPMENVSWNKCQEFILKLNAITGRRFRMPTEAEWEFAARGGNLGRGYAHSGGNDVNAVAWYWDNIPSQYQDSYICGPQRVAAKFPNELGLYDMNGNVAEMCQDYMGNTGAEAQTDPHGPASGNYRVTRGGAWDSRIEDCLVSSVSICWQQWGNSSIGLRLALDVDGSAAFRLSETVISVVEGESQSVDILNGDGAYQVECDNGNATGTISGNSLDVTGATVGNTTIRVTNTTTGATAVLNVMVTPVVTFTVGGVTFTMVDVEGGTYLYGGLEIPGGHPMDGEMPSPWVRTVPDLRIGKTEVTQALWQAVMGSNPSYFKGDLNRPVEQVSWEKCQEFILRLNEMTGMHFRLPTQAEWEFAAHGGNLCKARQYSGSNNIDDVAWYSGNSGNTTHAVATKQPNELGIHDMNGNVWEWCLDFALIDDGYGSTFTTNRARRGGCWSSTPANCTVLIEGSSAPDDAYNRLGLRLALDDEDSFSLSESVIAVAVGETKTVQILNGDNHFSYIRQENEETEHVRAILDYHDLHVTGLQAGITTVRVETNAGYPLYLTVIVTPQGRH